MKVTLTITPSHDQPYTLEYAREDGSTAGAPSYLEAYTEEEAREELVEEYGYSAEEVEALFNA